MLGGIMIMKIVTNFPTVWRQTRVTSYVLAFALMASFVGGINVATAGPFQLPPKGEQVSLQQIKDICLHYQMPELWQKIVKDPPKKVFYSDGCTAWFDQWRGYDLYPACFLHDLKYWSGYPGEDVARLRADADLMLDVAELLNDTVLAETMFQGVRLGGAEFYKAAFSWGFGRNVDADSTSDD